MPAITNNSPTNVQQFLEVVNVGLTNTAWDPDGYVTNVTFYTWSNSVPVALPGNVISNNLRYSVVWSNRTAGFYSYYSVATDNRGAKSSSPIGVFKVNPTNTPPKVWITFPTNNIIFPAGTNITITATTTNGSGQVTNVEFFVNRQRVGGDSLAPFSVTVCCWEAGSYEILAKATDTFGSIGISTQ